jgi:putative peptide zinc metalloprotease protein
VTATTLQRAEGLELLGALDGAGYRQGASLVRRRDGQTVQLTAALAALLEELDGRATTAELAQRLADRTGKDVTEQDVDHLLGKLADLGLLEGTETDEPATSNPLLALRWKVVVSDPKTTSRITAPFAALFTPAILWTVLAAFVGVCWFVLVEKGLASATRRAFDTPGLLLGVFALAVLSAGFHELGHAAACRYGGARPGAMGAGIYLVWPAFYTDVDDAYRLDRRGRLRVDLGGLYFNTVVAVVVTGLWLVTGEDALLLGVATQLIQMLHQLTPVFRADGYHILADLTGVPDLFAHLGPTLRFWRPSPLTRRARIIVTAWVAIVVPVLVSLLLTAALLFPRLVATAWSSGRGRAAQLGNAAQQGDLLGMGASLLQLVALVLPVLGTAYLLLRMASRVWAKADSHPTSRAVVAVLALTALLFVWWPSGQYTPVRGDERGTVTSLLSSGPAPVLPTRTTTQPKQLALALVPQDKSQPAMLLTRDAAGTAQAIVTGAEGGTARALPFALPDDLRPGETRALATNTQDGSTVYDVAYALVTVTDGAPVTQVNDAWALASCTACTTVAVSFQVVLVVGHSDVITPINAAVAANKGCLRCVTSALAVQLIVSVKEAPSPEVQAQLNAALAKLDAKVDPSQLVAQVTAVQKEVVAILTDADLVDAPVVTAVASATASPSAGSTTSATASATTSPSPSSAPSATPTASATPTPTATPSEEPTPTGTP